MIASSIIVRLHRAFPGSFVNMNGDFIAHRKSNTYFILENCHSERDIKCKMLEWLSRAACKGQPYHTKRANEKFNRFILDGINTFLETNFSSDDMALIYQRLGNCVRHNLTICFVESGYKMDLLKDGGGDA